MPEIVFLLLGSNLGDREQNLANARERIASLEGCELIASSSLYLSDAVDMPPDSPAFLNQVLEIEYAYPPLELLHACEKIEVELGRTDKGKMQPRPVDCDILLFGNQVIKSETLTVPHPKMLQRPFALVPLLEIDPSLVHPIQKKPIADFLTEKGSQSVLLYKDHVARTN
ncbi:MAG: 2-amino-4-hydroxy-6-hydroxymethyldihydropteridine diphosphokinase [bacterium]|nr:2-amino-4-hydroxy-6-hydroxymethyldihydropteridine diphosphokinase [bacterium]